MTDGLIGGFKYYYVLLVHLNDSCMPFMLACVMRSKGYGRGGSNLGVSTSQAALQQAYRCHVIIRATAHAACNV